MLNNIFIETPFPKKKKKKPNNALKETKKLWLPNDY